MSKSPINKIIISFFTIFLILSPPKLALGQNYQNLDNNQTSSWHCWDDGTIDPCHLTLYSVDLSASGEGWAVGSGGRILQLSDGIWQIYNSPTTTSLNKVQMLNIDVGWIVGDNGTILQWNGEDWKIQAFPYEENLNSISIVSANEIWVAGRNYLYHWNGSAWSQFTPPVGNLKAISMVPGSGGSDGWAVGSYGNILRWDGISWSSFSSPTDSYLVDVEMVSATYGWAVGYERNVFQWDGSDWNAIEFPIWEMGNIIEIAANSENDAWAIAFDNGLFGIYHWDGSAWLLSDGNTNAISYNDVAVVAGSNGSEVYIVGSGGHITEWNGDNWTPINDPYTHPISDAALITKDVGWAVASQFPISYGNILYWDGNKWEKDQLTDALTLGFVPGSGGTEGWAGGVFGSLYYWDNTAWTEVNSPVNVDINAIDILSSNDIWAVGGGYDLSLSEYHGTIIHREGDAWVVVMSPTSILTDIDMVSTDFGWAVGEDGAILQWKGQGWEEFSSPTTSDLKGIYMLDQSTGWIVGRSGTILRWDGTSWTEYTSPTLKDLNDIELLNKDTGWAVGSTILRWDGDVWSEVNNPIHPGLRTIEVLTQDEAWAFGDAGVILHFSGPTLSVNYDTGAPGSYFTITGSGYPPNTLVNIDINGLSFGTIMSDPTGRFSFILSTTFAEEGSYVVTGSVNPTASVKFFIDSNQPIREKEGVGEIIEVPDDLAGSEIFIPLILY